MPRALVIGCTGQDGSYLVEQLAADGHEVWGMVRRRHASPVPLVVGDLLDQPSLERALLEVRPDVVFNVAAVTAPGAGWGSRQPPLLADVTGLGVVRLLDAMLTRAPNARLVHASSSAIYDPHRYGLYGAAKLFAHDAVAGYRNRLHCSNAVLFSHTSPRQDPRFLAPRICRAAAAGIRLALGDVDARRDWGWAPDYCAAMRVIAEQDEPGDWIVATGVQHSVRELAEAAAVAAGVRWEEAFTVDATLPRVPDEIRSGDVGTVRDLGWRPSVTFEQMIQQMVVNRVGPG